MTTKNQVLELLETNQNERGIEHWEKLKSPSCELTSFGIGLTQLRKFAKQIGRDHLLAQQLWETPCYDAKIIGLLIDDPKQLTRERAEQQVEQIEEGMLAHVFACCDATLAKSSFAFELAKDWMGSSDSMRRHCGFTLLYELSKKKNIKGMDDAYCLDRIAHIQESFDAEEKSVRGAMGGALLGLGKRNRRLNQAAIQAAKKIGPIDISDEKHQCDPLDVLKHLTSDYLKKKLGTGP